jgi:hypothetical protein
MGSNVDPPLCPFRWNRRSLAGVILLVFIGRRRTPAGLWPLIALIVAGCSTAPEAVESRPELPRCGPNEDVYLPISQGPDEFESQSSDALECFLSSLEVGEQAEMEFILLGAEGEEYRAILQAFEDETVDYFRENDWGWEIYEGCSGFSLPEPGIPDVSSCDSTDIDEPG